RVSEDALVDTDIREIQDVAQALAAPAPERARGDAESEKLLRREAAQRAAAESLLRGEQAARAAAEAANRAKDEFLAMLGHELRNPLGAISNAASVLGRRELDRAPGAGSRAVVVRPV